MTVAEDPKNPAVLYAGTEFGLFVSTDRGGSWNRIRSGLPTVPIHEIVFHPRDNDMILATHGRSIWILDDATPIQQAAEAMETDAFLFDMRPAMQFNPANDRGFVTDKPFRGKNPTFGAPISYYLKGAVEERRASHSRRRRAPGARDHGQRSARRAQGRDQSRVLGSAIPAAARRAGAAAGGRRRWRRRRFAAAAATTARSSCPVNTASRWSSTARTSRPSPCAWSVTPPCR